MAESIIHDGNTCWLCGRNGSTDPLDNHHCFYGANRKLSEQDGLKVKLCHNSCHIFGPNAVHNHKGNREQLQREAQQAWMNYYGGTIEDFRLRYGKNYLEV